MYKIVLLVSGIPKESRKPIKPKSVIRNFCEQNVRQ